MGIKTFREGFTLVELSLSMVFIGILSVAIVLIISNTISSYQRGLTLNQVNTTGMAIVDDMRTAIQNSNARSLQNECYRHYTNSAESDSGREGCLADGGMGLVSHTGTGSVQLYDGPVRENVPLYGVFCTGDYSYVWNSGYYEANYAKVNGEEGVEKRGKWATLTYAVGEGTNKKTIKIVGSLEGAYDKNGQLIVRYAESGGVGEVGNPDKPFRLIKIYDRERAICSSLVRRHDNPALYATNVAVDNNFRVDNIGDNAFYALYSPFQEEPAPVDLLLEDGDNDLALYELYVAKPAESATQKNSFYSVSFILGTMRGGADIFAQGKNCQVPADYATEEFNYCAINKFSFGAATGGE